MTLFTVQVELGPETRALVERIASQVTVRFELGQIELGPKTRETIGTFVPGSGDRDEGLLQKAADAARGR